MQSVFPWQWREGQRPDGIILVDSFAEAGRDGYRGSYMRDLLQYIWWRTGQWFTCIQWNGAGAKELHVCARKAADRWGTVDKVLIISMGNDVYQTARKGIFNAEVVSAIVAELTALCRYAVEYLAPACMVIYGGSALTWSYDGSRGFADIYDRYCRSVCAGLLREGIQVSTGANVLGRLIVLDRIGHVHGGSMNVVFEAYVNWIFRMSVPRAKL